MKYVISIFVAALIAGCASQSQSFYVGGKEILGADFFLCNSKVKWQGTRLNVEGLKLDPAAAATTKSFSVAKFGSEQKQLHQLQNIALALDSSFTKWCEDANRLRRYPDQLKQYLDETSNKAERMFALLTQLETINLQSKDSADAAIKQQAAYDAVKPSLAAAPAPAK